MDGCDDGVFVLAFEFAFVFVFVLVFLCKGKGAMDGRVMEDLTPVCHFFHFFASLQAKSSPSSEKISNGKDFAGNCFSRVKRFQHQLPHPLVKRFQHQLLLKQG